MKTVVLMSLMALVVGSVAEAAPRAKGKKKSGNYESYSSEDSYSSSRSSGGGGHRMAGCGLGSMAIEDNSKWAQVGAAFLNGTGFQTFGITFGTSNCTEDGLAAAVREKDAFIEANLVDIRRDISVGEGAYLSSLASLYGCKGEASLGFGSALHKNQESIMNASDADAASAIDAAVASEKAACQG